MINSAMLAAPSGSVIQIGGGGQLPSFYYMQHNFNISNAYQVVSLLNDGYFIVWQYTYNGKNYEKRYYLNGTIGDC